MSKLSSAWCTCRRCRKLQSATPLDAIEEWALDARLLHGAGFDGCVVENFGDSPFHKDAVEPVTVAAMAHRGGALPGAAGLAPSTLRNDAASALAIASTCGGRFVRVNVHVGATATDQEWWKATPPKRCSGAPSVRTSRSGPMFTSNTDAAWRTHDRGRSRGCRQARHADAVIVGAAPVLAADRFEDLRRVAALNLGVPPTAGSGVTADPPPRSCRARWRDRRDGAGKGASGAPLDADRVRRFAKSRAVRTVR